MEGHGLTAFQLTLSGFSLDGTTTEQDYCHSISYSRCIWLGDRSILEANGFLLYSKERQFLMDHIRYCCFCGLSSAVSGHYGTLFADVTQIQDPTIGQINRIRVVWRRHQLQLFDWGICYHSMLVLEQAFLYPQLPTSNSWWQTSFKTIKLSPKEALFNYI